MFRAMVYRQQVALSFVQMSKFQFFLTGSRFFGTHTEESDWDFFVQYSQEVEPALINAGFKLETESYATDPNFVKVYKRENVHIQIVRDARHKLRVQHNLIPIMLQIKPTKEQARTLWAMMMKTYQDGYNERVMDENKPKPTEPEPDLINW